MTNPALLAEIFQLTRGDLDRAMFPLPPLRSMLGGMTALRLTRLAESRDLDQKERLPGPEEAAIQLAIGMTGLKCPWFFALRGFPKEIQCWFGIQKSTAEPDSLEKILAGTYPDARFAGNQVLDIAGFDANCAALQITGVPESARQG